MEIKNNTNKIINLYNKLQRAIIKDKFEVLKSPYECLAFTYYRMHIETFYTFLKKNLLGKLSLKLFQQLFEDKNNFKQFEEKNCLIFNNLIDAIQSENIIERKEILERFLMNILKDEGNAELRKLLKLLKYNFGIETELYYILIIYLINTNYQIKDFLNLLELILTNKYAEITFNLNDIFELEMTFNEFIGLLYAAADNKQLDDFMLITWEKTTKTVVIRKKTIEEIADFINESTSNNKTTANKKNKKNKSDNDKIKNKEENSNIIIEKNSQIKDKDEKINIIIANKNNIQNKIELKNDNNKSLINKFQKKEYKDINSSENFNNINSTKDNKQQAIVQNYNNEKEEIVDIQNLRKEIKEFKEKFKEIEEIKKKYEEIKNENEQIIKKYEEIKNENEEIKKENEKINKENEENIKEILKNKKRITKLEFEIKVIGLRSAYKCLIDLFIFIFNLNENVTLKQKVKSINYFLSECEKEKANKIKSLINDILDIINNGNFKAHYIEVKTNLFEELKDIIYYFKFNNHNEIFDIIANFKIEEDFKKYVFIKNSRFKISKNEYEIKEANIISKIRNNPFIKNGKGYSSLINS